MVGDSPGPFKDPKDPGPSRRRSGESSSQVASGYGPVEPARGLDPRITALADFVPDSAGAANSAKTAWKERRPSSGVLARAASRDSTVHEPVRTQRRGSCSATPTRGAPTLNGVLPVAV